MGSCNARQAALGVARHKKKDLTTLIVSVAFHICDENSDWPLRSGVAFHVRGLEAVHPPQYKQSKRAYEESSYRAYD